MSREQSSELTYNIIVSVFNVLRRERFSDGLPEVGTAEGWNVTVEFVAGSAVLEGRR